MKKYPTFTKKTGNICMKNDLIFIHIPKTGGTTINTAMNEQYWQSKPGFNHRHIVPKTWKSNSGDIFTPSNFSKFLDYKIFMMVRNPIDRVISEYHFIQERKNFIDLLPSKPKDFETYIKMKQTQNGMVNFLKGKQMYSNIQSTGSDLDDILDAIDQIPIHVGIFEEFDKSLQYFSNATGIKWNKKMDIKRMTFKRPQASELSDEITDLIVNANPLDMELYTYCHDKFNPISNTLQTNKFVFNADKYNHVIPYSANFCFFEFCMSNKKFIQINLDFFKALTYYIIDHLAIKDGMVYTQIWNSSFLNAISIHFPNSTLYNELKTAFNKEGDPLENTNNIGQAVDQFFSNHNNPAEFYKKMTFTPQVVVTPQAKNGLFSRIFKR